MPRRDWRLRVEDILAAIAAIADYTRGMDFEAFRSDRKTVHAVAHNLMVIGEAASALPDEIQERHTRIPWQDMRAMRNVLVHGYFGIREQIVWDTIRHDLPPLVEPLQRLARS